MGKGNRNRTGRDDEWLSLSSSAPAKNKKARPRKPLPKWVVPLISIVLAVAIVAGVALFAMNNNGFFKRVNVLVKSQTSGAYSINQQMAYFLVWNYYYEQASETWDYYEDLGYSSIMSYVVGASTKMDYCWGQSMTAAQNKLNTTIASSTLLQSYVALCDYGQKNNLKLTKEEKSEAISDMYMLLRSRAYDYYDYLADNGYSVTPSNVYYGNYLEFGRWWKTVFGSDFKESDMEKSAVVLALSNKVLSQWQNDKWEATDAAAEKLANPDRYYKTDYVSYSTTDAAVAALLAEVRTEEQLKDLLVNHYVENNYLELYNKYASGRADEAAEVLSNLKGKESVAEQQAALDLYGLTLTEYTEGDETLNEKVSDWMFSSARVGFDATQIKLEDRIIVVVLEGTDPVEEPEATEEAGETGEAEESGETEAGEGSEETGEEVTEPKKVKAALYTVNYLELDEDGMNKLKNTVRIALNLTDDETLEHYHSAEDQAEEFADALEAEGADIDALLADATNWQGIEKNAEGVPEAILEEVFALAVEKGDVLTVADGEKIHVVYVRDLTKAVPATYDEEGNETAPEEPVEATISYKTFNEPMYTVAAELQDGAKEELENISEDTENYLKPAALKAEDTLKKLNASYNKGLFMSNNGATTKTGTRADSKPSDMPEEVYQKALTMSVGGTGLADIEESTAKYLIYVSEQTDEGLTVEYLKIETYEAESYGEWLFATATLQDGEYISGVAEGDSKIIEKKDGDDEDAQTTYSFYLVKNAPMYLKTETVIRGGYLGFAGENAQERAEAAKNELAGKTGYELLRAAAKIESTYSPVVSNSIDEDSVTSTAVSDWLFDESRKANDIEILEEGGAYYVVVFGARMQGWESTAKSNVASEESSEWVQKLIVEGGYKVSEKALKKIKDVADEPETTEETTAAE